MSALQHHRRLRAPTRRSGAALIITLAFMILLAALLVIFFTQSLSYRQLSNGNYNDFKSATLGQSALETVVGDLVQEMTNGSSSVLYNQGGTNVAYAVTNNAYAVPQRSGTNYLGNVDQTPNLVRISIRSDGIAYPAVGSRASAASSTNAAVGGQYVSPARWNKHYLLPRNSSIAGTTNLDTTPIPNFIAPDWVFVTDQGPTVLTTPSTKTIGRYAYAIYDEGGLLDANVAGVPSNTQVNAAYPTTGPNTNLLVWGSGNKGSEAFADLTVPVPITVGSSTTQPLLTQPQIDQLVGWRHNATIQPSGSFGASTGNPLTASGYTIGYDSTGAKGSLAYHDAMALNTNGFLLTSEKSWADPTSGKTDTDQIFINRQALISFFNTAHLPQDSLQYFGTFSRDIQQPSYNPPVGRPVVQSSTNSDNVLYTVSGSTKYGFGTGNDAYHADRYGLSGQPAGTSSQDINPPFLSVRVTTTAFSRPDNTTANIGDPLVKRRFPLSRLSLFPVNEGTPSTANAALIYQYFGLTQSSGGLWTYNHGSATSIYRLDQVKGLGREPDFFELLKAAINVGTVGKGDCYQGNSSYTYWNISNSAANLNQVKDNQVQLQILQIGANIIDQSKADNYPTRIQFSGVPAYQVRGVEDLPYIYRCRTWIMRYGTTGSLGAVLFQPELWNPNSPQSSATLPASAMPKSFRVRLAADSTSGGTPISPMGVTYATSPYVDLTSTVTFNSGVTPAPLTFNAGEANGFCGFREPTLLAHIGKPALPYPSNLASTDPAYTDYPTYTPDPTRQITGFKVVTFPWIGATGLATDVAQKLNASLSSASSALRYYLEYLDPSGNWVTYDEQPYQPFDSETLNMKIVNTSGGYNDLDAVHLQSVANNPWGGGARTDPRTSRWGFVHNQYINTIPPITTGSSADTSTPSGADTVVFGSYFPDGNIGYGDHIGEVTDWAFAGQINSYGGAPLYQYGFKGFQHGYWSENSVRTTYQTDPSDSGYRYNLDPDGIPRRAVGGYVTDTSNGGSAATGALTQLAGLPMAANNPGSRPTILHRPFRSVAELGYVFRDSPWGDINFTFPESGDSPLLDVFCINETSDSNALVAGRVNLNTRQAPVIASLLSGTVRDKDDSTNPTISQGMASDLGKQLVLRTSNPNPATGYGPLINKADLVGTWYGPATAALSTSALTATISVGGAPNPDAYYSGFSYDIGTAAVPSVNTTPAFALIPRQRNAVMRALVDAGTTRTWNLLIDLVAQSGRFPPNAPASAAGLSQFVVEGEKHYWLHVALDRFTGKILDSQLEVVKE